MNLSTDALACITVFAVVGMAWLSPVLRQCLQQRHERKMAEIQLETAKFNARRGR